MALIRQVKVHENSRMWAYVEWSDEDVNYLLILGGKEFLTKGEAEQYAKGFATDSYTYVEPLETKVANLRKERSLLKKKLEKINDELLKLGYE